MGFERIGKDRAHDAQGTLANLLSQFVFGIGKGQFPFFAVHLGQTGNYFADVRAEKSAVHLADFRTLFERSLRIAPALERTVGIAHHAED